ncbi:MAG: hypothetical protein Tsb0015_14070 [Simkaniaceae bacterium]
MNYRVVVMESRKMVAIRATIINKTDKNDARGIAEALRVSHYQECVHRNDAAVEIRSLLHLRQTAIEERTHVITSLRGNLKVYGIKFSKKAGKTFRGLAESAIKELNPRVQRTIQSLLNILETLDEEIKALTREVEEVASKDEDVKLLRTIDGVGPITALAFKAEIDDPMRFKNSKDAPAYIGLTPKQYSSGEVHRQGGISKKIEKDTLFACRSGKCTGNKM